jgi:HTH-type transcriptional regulator/antitoxin HipB
MRLRTPTDIGLAIRERRRALGISQATLAAQVGVSREWIVEIEGGKRRAEIGRVLRTLEVLGLTLRTGEPPPSRADGTSPEALVNIDAVIAAHRKRGDDRR